MYTSAQVLFEKFTFYPIPTLFPTKAGHLEHLTYCTSAYTSTQVHKYTSAHSSTQLHKYTSTPLSHFLKKPIPCVPDIDVHQLSQKLQLQHVLSQLCCIYAHFVLENYLYLTNTFCPEDISTKQDTYALLQNGY